MHCDRGEGGGDFRLHPLPGSNHSESLGGAERNTLGTAGRSQQAPRPRVRRSGLGAHQVGRDGGKGRLDGS